MAKFPIKLRASDGGV